MEFSQNSDRKKWKSCRNVFLNHQTIDSRNTQESKTVRGRAGAEALNGAGGRCQCAVCNAFLNRKEKGRDGGALFGAASV